MRPTSSLLLLALTACLGPQGLEAHDLGEDHLGQTHLVEPAGPESDRLPLDPLYETLADDLREAFEAHPGRRATVQTDKPLYRPGETVWFRVFDVGTASLAGDGAYPVSAELLDPRGAKVGALRLRNLEGGDHNAFDLPAGTPGGRYVVRLVQADETVVEKPVMVASYETPRIQKDLDFVREAYGPGDTVQASLTLARATGEPLVGSWEAVIDLDGAELTRVPVTTDALGKAVVRFGLPDAIERGDARLTVLVGEGGVTESISRRVPIVLDRVDVALFPEGGDLVAGLPTRVYLRATTPLGEPADVSGHVVDDRGEVVSTFRTVNDGLGRFAFTPRADRRYRVALDAPQGATTEASLPEALASGCTLRTYDDPASQLEVVRVGVRCTDAGEVTVQGMLREQLVDAATVAVVPGVESRVDLEAAPHDAASQGVLRVTLFDGVDPLAERLVFRDGGRALQVRVQPRRDEVGPRDEIVVDVSTTTPDGDPVPASLAMAVVDETVLAYADDEEPHLLAALLLQSEIPTPIHEPNQYFDPEDPDRHVALDLLLGTAGWRRFDWEAALQPPANLARLEAERAQAQQPETRRRDVDLLEALGYAVEGAFDRMVPRRMPMPQMAEAPPVPMAAPMPEPEAMEMEEDEAAADAPAMARPVAKEAKAEKAKDVRQQVAVGGLILEDGLAMGGGRAARRGPMGGEAFGDLDMAWDANQALAWAPVRTYAAPTYAPGYEGPRTDFRDTIFWAPDVRTDERGKATVRFHASDAVTSFRITTEGTGGGRLGRDETTVASKLPFSLGAKLPVAVTQGDRIEMPLTLASELDTEVSVRLDATFGDALIPVGGLEPWHVDLDPLARDARWVTLDVQGGARTASVAVEAYGTGQTDAFTRELTIEPRGFPGRWEVADSLQGSRTWTLDLGEAIEGTVDATVQLYPSPVATLVEGMEGLLREPGGCFEQTSSSNYPNIMVLRYLQEHGDVDPSVAQRASGMLDRGYQLLTSYETSEEGYEWFGSAPAHEALTAYGLVEFVDMADVHGAVDPAMIDRTADYLLSRRDGRGGYQRNGRALDSFGRASDEVTDAYITWSLALAGYGSELDAELDRARQLAKSTDDPYLLALAAGTLIAVDDRGAAGAVRRLEGLQGKDGSWPGADHSITRSGGENLAIETTSLALLALLEVDPTGAAVRDGVGWLQAHRSGYGNFGSTQATVLALKAMTAYAQAARRTAASGYVSVEVNGELVGDFAYEAGHQGAITFADLGPFLRPGVNTLTVTHDGDEALPLSAAVDYRTDLPASSPDTVVALDTRLDRTTIPMGETVRLTAELANTTDEGQPMALARIGLPGGLVPQTWQLEELREQGVVDFYETRPREIALYFRDLAPGEVHEVPLDLIAEVPGSYTAPASQAYLYYTDEHRTWVAGTEVTIERP